MRKRLLPVEQQYVGVAQKDPSPKSEMNFCIEDCILSLKSSLERILIPVEGGRQSRALLETSAHQPDRAISSDRTSEPDDINSGIFTKLDKLDCTASSFHVLWLACLQVFASQLTYVW